VASEFIVAGAPCHEKFVFINSMLQERGQVCDYLVRQKNRVIGIQP